MATERACLIVNADVPITSSPSGLPSQHLVARWSGAESIFVGQQWLQRGDRVLLHTHPVEEALLFLTGVGEATVGHEVVRIVAETSLRIPAGVTHGFTNTGTTPLHVLIVFPGPDFAPTTIVESDSDPDAAP